MTSPVQDTGVERSISTRPCCRSFTQVEDLVMLLHREAMYEQDAPREGEADNVVATHRNAPTKTMMATTY